MEHCKQCPLPLASSTQFSCVSLARHCGLLSKWNAGTWTQEGRHLTSMSSILSSPDLIVTFPRLVQYHLLQDISWAFSRVSLVSLFLCTGLQRGLEEVHSRFPSPPPPSSWLSSLSPSISVRLGLRVAGPLPWSPTSHSLQLCQCYALRFGTDFTFQDRRLSISSSAFVFGQASSFKWTTLLRG